MTQGELSPGCRKRTHPKAPKKGWEAGEVFPCSRGTPVSAQGFQGHGRGGGTAGTRWWLPPISHTRSLDSSEDAWGWHRAWVAVSSGSSFPRNPLGTRLGIPGNTVLGATARQPIPREPQLRRSQEWRYRATGRLGGGDPTRGVMDVPVGHHPLPGAGLTLLLPCPGHPGSIKVSTRE